MVGISTGLAHHFNSLIHGKCLFLYQDPYQLRNHHGRMGIIDLDHGMLIHLAQIVLLFLHLAQDQLGRIGYHEILLINTKQVTSLV